MVILALDPGRFGCTCVLDGDSFHFYDFSEDTYYDDIRSINKSWPDITRVAIESCYAAGFGAGKRLEKFFHARGCMYGSCRVLWGDRVMDLLPKAWQKDYDLPRDYKEKKLALVEIAKEKFPHADISTSNRERTSGRADSALMAHYVRHLELNHGLETP